MENKKQATPATTQKSMLEGIIHRVTEMTHGGLRLPGGYSPENAIRSAWLTLLETKTKDGKSALEVCSKESIANAMMKMVTQGLNPAKKQCYFIPYGSKLELLTSYFGEMAIGYRAGLKFIRANVVRKGEEFTFHTEPDARVVVDKHTTTIETIDNPVVAAYCVIQYPNDEIDTCIMSMKSIQASWQQGATKGNSPAHKNFPEEMAKRTVINRAIKPFTNSTNDSTLYVEDEVERDHKAETDAYVEHEIESNGGAFEIGFDEPEAEPEPKPQPKPQQKKEPAQTEMSEPGF